MTTLTKALREMLEFNLDQAMQAGEAQWDGGNPLHYDEYFSDGVEYENDRLKPLHDALIEIVEKLEIFNRKLSPGDYYWFPEMIDALTKLKAAIGVKNNE